MFSKISYLSILFIKFLDDLPREDNDIPQSLKTSKIFLDKKLKENLCLYIKNNIELKNILLHYTIAYIFNLSNLAKISMSYAERCFLMVVETNNFLELDFSLVKKILLSSKLHITSELEVFYAIND